jgi:hypothetical protein
VIDPLKETWLLESTGGSWNIITFSGNIIAQDMPFGDVAEEIVRRQNESIEE